MIRNLLFHSQNKLGGKTITRRKNKTNRRLNPSSMAFWGALVRTDEPFNVVLDGGPHRRLRISQATLGTSRDRNTECNKSRNRLYCKVRGNPRVLLCVLRFNGTEMCCLDLEFTAPDNVVFSVVGVRDIHISGYYFNEFRLPYTIMPQNQIREEVETSGDTFVLECPPGQGDGSQIGGQHIPMQHVEETGIDAPRPAEEIALHVGGDQHINDVEENRSPSIGTFMRSVVEDSQEPLLGTRDPHQPLVSGVSHNEIQNQDSTAEVTEKYGEINGQNVEAIINRIVAEVEMGLEAESIGYNENQMAVHVVHAEKPERNAGERALHEGADQHINLVEEIRSPSINKCLGIETRASQRSLMNMVAKGQRQAILGSSWKDMQNLPELLMHIFYCFLTKVPYNVGWTNIALSSKGKEVQETLHVLNSMTRCFTHRVKSTRLGEKCNSDDGMNCFSNLVQGDSRVRHVEKITLCELEQPGNAIVETDSERIGEGESTEPDESWNNVHHLRGNSER